jgi:hypothetical protein
MTDYKINGNGVFRKSDGASIPNVPGNSDWNEYQAYVAAGGVTDPEYTVEEIQAQQISALRAERNNRLSALDHYGLADVWAMLTTDEKTEISNYRQALRDLPENTPDPANVTWPVKPSWAKEQAA